MTELEDVGGKCRRRQDNPKQEGKKAQEGYPVTHGVAPWEM
ncbi:hypothetical protein [Desulfolutivibrio sulfodismutans]|nr:hypothetical protein [Desulfolutivibrio sulfodismutans]